MSLTRIILPQAVDGVIEKSSIELEGGILVRIPYYAGAQAGNVVQVFLNNKLVDVFSIISPINLPNTVTVGKEFATTENNLVHYTVIWNSGNIEDSPVETFSIASNSNVTLTLSATSGARANGSDTNQATVSLYTNAIPQSGQQVTLTLIGSAIFSNNASTIIVTTNNSGTAQAVFSSNTVGTVTIRAQYLAELKEIASSFSAVTPSATLSSVLINNNVPAGEEKIYIQYQLKNADGTPIVGAMLSLSSSSEKIIFDNTQIYTTNNGIVTTGIKSSQSGSFIINAIANTSPSVKNTISVNFTEGERYLLTALVTNNGAIANNTASNIVRFQLVNASNYTPVAAKVINVTTNGALSHLSSVTTDSSGFAYLNVTSAQPGVFSGSAYPAGYMSPTVLFSMSFISVPNQGVLVGSEYIWIAGNISLDVYLKNYQIIMGHRYKLVTNRPPSSINNCWESYVFNTQMKACVTNFPDSYTFYNNDLLEFRATNSGLGANLFTRRYHEFHSNNYGYAYIELWDYGNASFFSSAAPLLLTDQSQENRVQDPIEDIDVEIGQVQEM